MTPGDIATKHPDESLGDFYTRREQGHRYERRALFQEEVKYSAATIRYHIMDQGCDGRLISR